MREVRVEKVVVNIGVGESGDRLVKAESVMKALTGVKPSRTRARTSNRDWGIRRGQEIGVKVTLRREPAMGFLKEALAARGNKVPAYSFDRNGNLAFGITDHTEFKKLKYDPETGIFGMDITVTFSRPGARVKFRRIRPASIGRAHRVTPEEAQRVLRETTGAEVVA